jgi:hypothetical protein
MAIRRAKRFQLTNSGSGIEERSVTSRAYYACYRIGVDNRDYHYLSQLEIGGAKRISQHQSAARLRLFASLHLEQR